MAYVYRHIRNDKNLPFYIGIGSDEKGKYTRAKRKTCRSKLWESIVKNTTYEIEILEDGLSWEEALEKEMWWIKFYGRIDNGTGILVNHTDGGDGMVGWKASEEIKSKLSEVRKGRVFSSGWKQSEETKENLRKIRKGISPANKGVPLTEEQKKKLSESRLGSISEKRKPVICIETNEIFPSIEHAERDPRFYRGAVAKVLSGLRKSAKGFHFEYYEIFSKKDDGSKSPL